MNPNRQIKQATQLDYDIVRNKNTYVAKDDLEGLDDETRNELMMIDNLNNEAATSLQVLSGQAAINIPQNLGV